MKRTDIYILLLVILTSYSHAKSYNDYFIEARRTICKRSIKNEENNALDKCTVAMRKDSEMKLAAREREIDIELKILNDKNINNQYFRVKKSWEIYKRDRCRFRAFGPTIESVDHQANINLCYAVENYRRIETLFGEPSFP